MKLESVIHYMQRERYNVLVSCRPLAPARGAWNRALQGVIDAMKACGELDAVGEADLWTACKLRESDGET